MVCKMDHTTTASHPEVPWEKLRIGESTEKTRAKIYCRWKPKGVFKGERRHSKGRQMKKEGNRKGKIMRAVR
jgi:hypothetical protein